MAKQLYYNVGDQCPVCRGFERIVVIDIVHDEFKCERPTVTNPQVGVRSVHYIDALTVPPPPGQRTVQFLAAKAAAAGVPLSPTPPQGLTAWLPPPGALAAPRRAYSINAVDGMLKESYGTVATQPIRAIDPARFPHKCLRCGQACYIGVNTEHMDSRLDGTCK
jgi:hypothetical protein